MAQHGKFLRGVNQHAVISVVHRPQGDGCSDQTDQHALQHKGSAHEKVRCADIFHNIDLFLAHRNTDGHGVADQKHGHRQQYHNDAQGHISDQKVHAAQGTGRKGGIVHQAYPFDGVQISHQRVLHGHIAQVHHIIHTPGQGIFRITCDKLIHPVPEINLLIVRPRVLRGNINHLRHFRAAADHGTDLLDPGIRDIILKKDGDTDILLRTPDHMLEIGHNRIENPKQKEACRNSGDGCQRVPFVAEQVAETLLYGIKECANLHRLYMPLPLHR